MQTSQSATGDKATSPILDSLYAHSSLCEEVYDFFLEENRHLRSTEDPVSEELSDRKRFLLKALEASLERLRGTIRQGGYKKTALLRGAAAKAQRILLRAMLLDKENEQLLLKHALSSTRGDVQIIPKPTAKQVRRRYELNK